MSFAFMAIIEKLKLEIAELKARLDALEAKRGPGRPPKEDKAA